MQLNLSAKSSQSMVLTRSTSAGSTKASAAAAAAGGSSAAAEQAEATSQRFSKTNAAAKEAAKRKSTSGNEQSTSARPLIGKDGRAFKNASEKVKDKKQKIEDKKKSILADNPGLEDLFEQVLSGAGDESARATAEKFPLLPPVERGVAAAEELLDRKLWGLRAALAAGGGRGEAFKGIVIPAFSVTAEQEQDWDGNRLAVFNKNLLDRGGTGEYGGFDGKDKEARSKASTKQYEDGNGPRDKVDFAPKIRPYVPGQDDPSSTKQQIGRNLGVSSVTDANGRVTQLKIAATNESSPR